MHNKVQKYPQFVSNFPLLLLLKVYSTLSVLTQCICRTKYQSSCFLQISFLLPFSYTIHVHVTSHNLHKIPRHYKPQNALSPVIFLSFQPTTPICQLFLQTLLSGKKHHLFGICLCFHLLYCKTFSSIIFNVL